MKLKLNFLFLFLLCSNFHQIQSYNSKNQKVFLNACKKGDLSTVQSLLASQAANPDGQTKNGVYKNLPPIVAAAQYNHTDIVTFLLKNNANPNIIGDVIDNQKEPYCWTAIQWTAFHGNIEATQALLDAGAVPDITNHTANTALNRAVKHGGPKVLALLLRNPNFKLVINRCYKYTPLAKAAALGKEEEVELLLQHGADPDLFIPSQHSPHTETSPLVEAACAQHMNIIKILLRHHAHPGLPTRWGTAAQAAEDTWCFFQECKNKRKEIVAFLKQYKEEKEESTL